MSNASETLRLKENGALRRSSLVVNSTLSKIDIIKQLRIYLIHRSYNNERAHFISGFLLSHCYSNNILVFEFFKERSLQHNLYGM